MGQYFRNLFNSIVSFFEEHVVIYFKQFSVSDFLDIVVLSVMIYLVYKFIRNRRAERLAAGLGIFAAIMIASAMLNMKAVNYIFQTFYQIGLLAIIIVFQPEVRAALEKVGNSPFSRMKNDTNLSSAITYDINAICEASCDMARTKTGALIVIERSTKLGEYIKTGITINALITPFLLRNIFFNGAPLHDGAVIIRSHKIFAAGCFLPLSTNSDIVNDLGTRHRAAIGLSETSDAVVLVVSEETGTISVAVDGNLKRNFNYNSLKKYLTELLVHTPKKNKELGEAIAEIGAPDSKEEQNEIQADQ